MFILLHEITLKRPGYPDDSNTKIREVFVRASAITAIYPSQKKEGATIQLSGNENDQLKVVEEARDVLALLERDQTGNVPGRPVTKTVIDDGPKVA